MHDTSLGSRRRTGFALALMAAGIAFATPALAQDIRRHALSLIGEPKYKSDFKHFGWVNPDAPKGGRARMFVEGTFDSLNPWPIQGVPAGGLTLVFDQLFEGSPDEASTEYAHVAMWASYPPDYSSVTFELNPAARFHDGKPITVDDVIFSLEALKKSSPNMSQYYRDVERAEQTGERQVTFRFSVKGNRELPHIISQLSVLPKHWWEAKGANGEPRDIMKSSLDVPLGSGPYRVKSFEPGRRIVYERVKDWWAKDLPGSKGQHNFDEIELSYFRERIAGFEAFKAGTIDFWQESSAKGWAVDFDFDAVSKGWVKRIMPSRRMVTPMQGYFPNLRRPIFQDVRVRRALNLAFDFEWANKNLFYDQYARTGSYFDNSDLAAKGLPAGRELDILTEVKADIPPEVFTTEYKNPVNPTPEAYRANLAQAAKLLAEAGYTPKDGVLTNAKGQKLEFEILLNGPIWDRIVQPYKTALERLGMRVSIRQVDSAQYQRRLDQFDFDLIVHLIAQSESPGNEQRTFWGSEAADKPGSRNVLGIKNPVIDKLVEKVIFAKDREDLVAATRALDRVLLWNHYVVPQWYMGKERIAYWDMFAGPANPPSRGTDFLRTWWFDEAAAEKLRVARGR
jgi:microcin C transport system substrate-binding protein